MSLSFPERLLVRLAPAEVGIGMKTIACEPQTAAEPWQGAIAALKGEGLSRRCRITVELSNHFVRYALVPWSEALTSMAEEAAYVRHHFARIHGERAKAWTVRASEAPLGAPRLASAVDKGLIDALKAAFPAKGKAKLVSVQPALMALFNRSRGAVPKDGAWVALAEPDRACVALHMRGSWRAVQNAKGAWLALLERTRLALEAESPQFVLLLAAGVPAGEAPGWKVQALE